MKKFEVYASRFEPLLNLLYILVALIVAVSMIHITLHEPEEKEGVQGLNLTFKNGWVFVNVTFVDLWGDPVEGPEICVRIGVITNCMKELNRSDGLFVAEPTYHPCAWLSSSSLDYELDVAVFDSKGEMLSIKRIPADGSDVNLSFRLVYPPPKGLSRVSKDSLGWVELFVTDGRGFPVNGEFFVFEKIEDEIRKEEIVEGILEHSDVDGAFWCGRLSSCILRFVGQAGHEYSILIIPERFIGTIELGEWIRKIYEYGNVSWYDVKVSCYIDKLDRLQVKPSSIKIPCGGG